MELMNVKEIKKNYEVWGQFYRLDYGDDRGYDCRRLLEIKKKSNDAKDKRNRVPDAIFVMMNPGGGKPIDSVAHIPSIKYGDIGKVEQKACLIEMIPDQTQDQVIRVMEHFGWKYVQVYNLSDIREPGSGKFANEIKEISKFDEKNVSSIFSEERGAEFNEIFKRKQVLIILAYGRNPAFKSIFKLQELKGRFSERKSRVYGRTDGKEIHYYHPSPRSKIMREKWLEDIIKQLENRKKKKI